MDESVAAPLPCASKHRFTNRKRAAQAASNLRKRIAEARGSEPIHAYHCEDCHGWHVGHPIGWRKANQRPRLTIRTTL